MSLRLAWPAANHWKFLTAGLTCLAAMQAQAGRPLTTDDAGANNQAVCQIETWLDKASDAHSTHLAPACGLLDGLELGLEFIRVSPGDEQTQGRAIGLKWAPEWASWEGWRFGLKAGTSAGKAPDEPDWHQAANSFSALASLSLTSQWTLHLNLGREHDRTEHTSANTYAVALAWTPSDRWVLFGEMVGHHNIPATQAVGLRYWLLPEQLGLDVTASRTNATADSRAWGVGIGWYGIKF
ncbi:MAG TPA: hypothetical protein VFW93_11280 [Aquabacterium sp.]|uniref:hypothetical protein n=1 Tax=Aquabacterium sp. TaxID=1872578 RepID=UPI002E31855B|nr:hypothetical protein [Aquabacterium sp.]HEX5356792.1 hypothetical protein [Aquabacterium sp.]